MDNELIEKLISSDEMIIKTIEENSQSLNVIIDGFSSIMSMTTVDGDKLEKQIEEQSEKEAENIKGTLTESINQSSNLSLEQVAEAETSISEGTILSDETINSLIDVISNVQTVLENLNTETLSNISTVTTPTTEVNTENISTVTTPTTEVNTENISTVTTPTTEVNTENISNVTTPTTEAIGFNTGNLTQVIDDFKTLSNLNWCTDWLKCLEKIIEQADVVKEALGSIPSDKKVSLGINEDDLQKVDQSIQKVKEDISTDINLSVAKTEMIEQATQAPASSELSTGFLNNFSDLTEKISSFTEKVENNTVSQESFVNKVNQFSETTSKTIENTFTTFSDTTKTILEKPNTFETLLQSRVVTEAKPQTEIGVGFEEMTNMPMPPFNQSAVPMPPPPPPTILGSEQGNVMPPLIQVLPMPPMINEIGKKSVLEETTTNTGTVKQEVVNISPPPLISPEMSFEGLLGQVPMPMPPIAPKVESGASTSVSAPPIPLNIEDFLSFKSPTVETTNISTEISKEEIIPLDLEKLFNFEPSLIPSNTIKETNTNFIGLQEPVGFEQLNNMGNNIIPPQTQNMGFQIETSPKSFGMQISPFAETTEIPNKENETIVQNIQNIPLSSFNPFENMFQMKNPTTTAGSVIPESTLEQSTNLTSSIEEIFIKNQESPQINLGSAISKIQNEMSQAPSEIAASTEVMMNEVNLEPLESTLSSSITSLGENLKTPTTTQVAPVTTEGEPNNVMNEVLNMLTKLDSTLQGLSSTQGRNTSVPSLGNSLSDAQARMIGRQIANELKDSFSRLYN
jgi:hypothetical protein